MSAPPKKPVPRGHATPNAAAHRPAPRAANAANARVVQPYTPPPARPRAVPNAPPAYRPPRPGANQTQPPKASPQPRQAQEVRDSIQRRIAVPNPPSVKDWAAARGGASGSQAGRQQKVPAPAPRANVIQRAEEPPKPPPAKKAGGKVKWKKFVPAKSAPVAAASVWGKPVVGAKPAFLQDENEGLSQAEIFPALGGGGGGGSSSPPAISISIPTAAEVWASMPVVVSAAAATAAAPPDPLAGVKAKIEAWDRLSHAGANETLTEGEIDGLTAWARAVRSRAGNSAAFKVKRGAGSGAYAAKDQLKIISIHSAPTGGKQPTYHVTLRT